MRKGVAAVGGTFDRLHEGHKELILEAFRLRERVVVGLTSDRFVREAGKSGVAPYSERRKQVLEFLKSRGLASRAKVIKIDDCFGPVVDDGSISSIVVTKETQRTAVEANQLRASRGLEPMEIRVIEMVMAQDRLPISSSRIRSGELDEHGRLVSRKPA